MPLLTASELAGIQELARQGMDSTATILRRITIQTDDGQQSEWATVGDSVQCWVYQITPLGGTLGAVSGAVAISQTFSIRMPVGTDVSVADHLVVGSQTYVVEQTNAESTIVPWMVAGCRTLE